MFSRDLTGNGARREDLSNWEGEEPDQGVRRRRGRLPHQGEATTPLTWWVIGNMIAGVGVPSLNSIREVGHVSNRKGRTERIYSRNGELRPGGKRAGSRRKRESDESG